MNEQEIPSAWSEIGLAWTALEEEGRVFYEEIGKGIADYHLASLAYQMMRANQLYRGGEYDKSIVDSFDGTRRELAQLLKELVFWLGEDGTPENAYEIDSFEFPSPCGTHVVSLKGLSDEMRRDLHDDLMMVFALEKCEQREDEE